MRDTVAAVFRQHAYSRETVTTTRLSRFFARIARWVASLLETIGRSPAATHTIEITVVVIALLIVGHFVILAYAPSGGYASRFARHHANGAHGDPWALAQQLAANGRYTEAAHALYAALLARVAARNPLRLHPSKTAGDYARDLRRSAPSVFGPFRDFARRYEVVIYGLGTCDRPRFQSLVELAGRIDPELGSLG